MAMLDPDRATVQVVRSSPRASDADDATPLNDTDGDSGVSPYAALALAEIAELRLVLDKLGVSVADRILLASRAGELATTFQAELLASGLVSERSFFAAIAQELGIAFAATVESERLVIDETRCLALLRQSGKTMMATLHDGPGQFIQIVAPDQSGLKTLRRFCDGKPDLKQRMRIVAPSDLRAAILLRSRHLLTRLALTSLADKRPTCSARRVLWAWQAYALGLLTVVVPLAIATVPVIMLLMAHLSLTLFFIACATLRIMAAIGRPLNVPQPISLSLSPELPVYSVLVALSGEAEVVPDLLVGLSKLQWPRSRLEIKLVCEEGDTETIEAISIHPLRSYVEIIVVPASLPRTKPKALTYALPLTTGAFIVLYDAEDQPHPMQLAEAWDRFRDGSPDLACLQAPLEISNRGGSLVASMFGFEYAALFQALLPWLASKRLMLPLGGTSNHFRREALESVGQWDPYNVTEDADLGLRLARNGYRCETLSCSTREEGPEDLATWFPQRVRWFKGWMQTWLVHMRDPRALAAELPFASFVVTQVLFAGMILSALLHVVLVMMAALLVVQISFALPVSMWQSRLVMVDALSVAFGYASFLTLGWLALKPQARRGFWKVCLFIPVYWTMLSLAAWCALWELWRRPHHWAKTPHRKARSA